MAIACSTARCKHATTSTTNRPLARPMRPWRHLRRASTGRDGPLLHRRPVTLAGLLTELTHEPHRVRLLVGWSVMDFGEGPAVSEELCFEPASSATLVTLATGRSEREMSGHDPESAEPVEVQRSDLEL